MSRYSPNAFKYNDRIALALLPSIVILSSYAGQFVSAVLLAGAMVTYIMDTLRWKEAALASVWLTLVAANIGFLVSAALRREGSVVMVLGGFGIHGATLMSLGIWATLQFKWILLQFPEIALPMERLLIAIALPIAMAVQSWGLSAAVGIEMVPFSTMVIGCILYAMCMQPLPTSFQKQGPGIGGSRLRASRIQGRYEGAVSAIAICLFPLLVYIASHSGVLFESEHFWSVHLLWSVPTVFICALPDGLWWLGDDEWMIHYIRNFILVAAGSVALVSFEGRVILHSFGMYIPLTFPYTWIVVSTYLFLNALIFGAHINGYLTSRTGFVIGTTFLVLSACAGGLAVGLPLVMMPAPLIGSAAFALFYDSGLLRDYLLFFSGTIISFGWLIFHHFWFLDISVGFLSLRTICQLIIATTAVSLMIPGLIIAETYDLVAKRGAEFFLFLQTVALTLLEKRLYTKDVVGEDDVIYPAYLILTTSILGIWFSKKMVARECISRVMGWILQCIFIAKMSLLLLPQAVIVLPALGMALTISPPFLLMPFNLTRLPSWKGTLIAASVVVSVLLARMAIFDVVQEFISAHPPEGLLLGMLTLIAAAGCLPLFYRFYTHSPAARRSVVLSIAFGTLLCFLRPPLPIKGTVSCPNLPAGLCPRLWDERHVPDHEIDDLEMYGMGWTRREHWPLWLIIAAFMTGLAAMTSRAPSENMSKSRLLWATLGGLCVGCYLSLEYFQDQWTLQFLCTASTVVACGLLAWIQQPSDYRRKNGWVPIVAFSWLVAFTIAFLIQDEMPLPPIPPEMHRLFPDAPQLMDRERRKLRRVSMIAIFTTELFLMAFACKLKVSRTLKAGNLTPQRSGSAWDTRSQGMASMAPVYAFCGPGRWSDMISTIVPAPVFNRMAELMKMPGAGGAMMRKLASEGLGWVPTFGNIAAMEAFLLSFLLNHYFTHGRDIGIFMAAPILLLLNQDPIIFRDLSEKRRYFPVVVTLAVCLVGASLLVIFYTYLDATAFARLDQPFWFVIRHLVGLLASMPSLVSFMKFLWVPNQIENSCTALTLLPLNLVPLLLSDISYVLDLGAMGFIGSLTLSIVYSNLRHMGQRLI